MNVRVRFAPSPTGYLHVGGLRTALYNYLFAKHHNGKMILRIEDTDRTRLVENAQENLIDALSWAGIEFDESPVVGGDYGPYVQSERLEIYRKYAFELLENGHAYYAFDTSEELDEMRKRLQAVNVAPQYDRHTMRNQITLGEEETRRLLDSGAEYVLRLKVPHAEEIVFTDIIRGPISVQGVDVDDQVLLKSDGFPTYHLANVVDDYLMKITHVIRGEEWLPSVPKHILLYKFLGWQTPEFAHLPLLLNSNKSKLSKRQGDVSVEDFRAKGYLRNAFVNFIALLGWNPTADREIFTIDELIQSFNLAKVNKAGAVFDLQKLEWMNSQYIKNEPAENLAKDLEKVLENYQFEEVCIEYLIPVCNLFRQRINFVKEIPEIASYMFEKPTTFEEEYMAKRWTETAVVHSKALLEVYQQTDDFSHSTLSGLTKSYCESAGIKLGEVIHPLRLMITGKSVGAGMFETMEVLGKDECLERMHSFLESNS